MSPNFAVNKFRQPTAEKMVRRAGKFFSIDITPICGASISNTNRHRIVGAHP